MHAQSARAEFQVAETAARQHGAVSAGQLMAAGLDKDAIRRRVGGGRLFPVHRGVYSVGHPALSREGRMWAALLACGKEAVLSHGSAAALWCLLPHLPAPVDVSVPSRNGRKPRRGIRIHRPVSLPKEACTRKDGIPVTTPVRTIADLRRVITAGQLRRAIREAEAQGLAIGREVISNGTRSELEHLFLGLCRRHGLPPPEVNAHVGRWRVDFLWRDAAVVVETDGYRFHSGRIAFEEDRARGLELRALGYEVIRLSYRQVVDEPRQTGIKLEKILSGAPNSRPSRRKRPASA